MLRRALPALLVPALLAAACSSDDAAVPATGAPTPTSETPAEEATTTTAAEAEVEALDTAEAGPYRVGRQTVTVTDPDRPDRTLTVDLWYPTDAEDGEPSTYSFAPGIEYDSDEALDAPPVAEGPFPLVVYSHGSGGLRYVASFFTERLASHGVVVAAPDHAGNTTLDQFLGSSAPPDVNARNRPLDVSAVLDALLEGGLASDVSAQIDAEQIGVAGHSLGGYTAFAVGGGVDDIPADDRVSALVAMAPASERLDDDELRAVDVPTMLLSGTLDDTTPIDPDTERPADLIAGRPLVRIDLEGATHQSFSDVCHYVEILPELPAVTPEILDLVSEQAGRTCDDDVLDVDRAQELVNRYAIAFLLAQLTGDEAAAAALDPDQAPDEAEVTVSD